VLIGLGGFPFSLHSIYSDANVEGEKSIKISPAGGYNDLYFSSTDVLVETFKHYIEKLDERNLAYLQVMQYNAYGDANFDGHPQGYDHDVIATYKSLVKRSNFVVNCGYDGAKGEKEVAERGVAAITYGQAFISNPDYLKRIQEGLPLNELNPKVSVITLGDSVEGS
jgi:N-ethylmaleimide reductase